MHVQGSPPTPPYSTCLCLSFSLTLTFTFFSFLSDPLMCALEAEVGGLGW